MSTSKDARMSPSSLIIHCLFERHGDQWQAFSLEFGLAAQASSIDEAESKLQSMVESYVFDALVGEDKEHASTLLKRRATMSVYVRYYYTALISHFKRLTKGGNGSYRGTYERPVPMMPASCGA